jgi:hypothetical protein
MNLVLLVLLFVVFDRGRIVSPAYSRLQKAEIDHLRAITAQGPQLSRKEA